MPVDTLRFYESRGLMAPAQRTSSGYRLYEPSIFDRLAFIKKAQSIGFSIEEIGRLIEEARDGRPPCSEVRRLAAEKLEALESRISELVRYRKELRETVKAWERKGSKKGHVCGLIEGLGEVHTPERSLR